MSESVKVYTLDNAEYLPRFILAVPATTSKTAVKELFLNEIRRHLKQRGCDWNDVNVNKKNIWDFVDSKKMTYGKIYTEYFGD